MLNQESYARWLETEQPRAKAQDVIVCHMVVLAKAADNPFRDALTATLGEQYDPLCIGSAT